MNANHRPRPADPAGRWLTESQKLWRVTRSGDIVLVQQFKRNSRCAPGHRSHHGLKAVYPDEAITADLASIARRRTLRPTDEQ